MILDDKSFWILNLFSVNNEMNEVYEDDLPENIVKAREGGKYTSIEDFEKRSKINQTLLETFKELGVLDGLSAKDIAA